MWSMAWSISSTSSTFRSSDMPFVVVILRIHRHHRRRAALSSGSAFSAACSVRPPPPFWRSAPAELGGDTAVHQQRLQQLNGRSGAPGSWRFLITVSALSKSTSASHVGIAHADAAGDHRDGRLLAAACAGRRRRRRISMSTPAIQAQQFVHQRAIRAVDRLHRRRRQAAVLAPAGSLSPSPGWCCASLSRRAGSPRCRFRAQAGDVDGDVRPRLVNHAGHAERHPAALSFSPLSGRLPSSTWPTGSFRAAYLAHVVGDRRQPRQGQQRAVEQRFAHAGGAPCAMSCSFASRIASLLASACRPSPTAPDFFAVLSTASCQEACLAAFPPSAPACSLLN